MSILKKPTFQQFEDFDDEDVVTFVYEDGCDVVHFNETHVETLDGYEREGMYSGFQDYVAQTIKENFYDMGEFVEESTEHFDHKRGFTNLRTELKVKVGNLRNMKSKEMSYSNPFNYWTAEASTPKGMLSFTVKD